MARYTGPVCRLCRREGMKLFLKGERCYTEKCAIEKRNFAARTARQDAQAEAGRLRPAAAREAEGQAHLRRARGPVPPLLRDGRPHARHHRRDAAAAARAPARQRRLPPRLRHLAAAGAAARAPRPLPVNGKKVDIPSYSVRAGDVVAVRPTSQKNPTIAARDRGGQGPRHSGLAHVRRRRPGRPHHVAADARADQPAGAGTADRRVVLEVVVSRRTSASAHDD